MLLYFQVLLVALRSSAVRMFLFSFDPCAAWLARLSCGRRWIASQRMRKRERITSIVACMHFATEWSDYALRWHIIWFARALHDDDDKTQKTWLPYSMQKKTTTQQIKKTTTATTEKNGNTIHARKSHGIVWLCVAIARYVCFRLLSLLC